MKRVIAIILALGGILLGLELVGPGWRPNSEVLSAKMLPPRCPPWCFDSE